MRSRPRKIGELSDALAEGVHYGRSRQPMPKARERYWLEKSSTLRAAFVKGYRRGRRIAVRLEQQQLNLEGV